MASDELAGPRSRFLLAALRAGRKWVELSEAYRLLRFTEEERRLFRRYVGNLLRRRFTEPAAVIIALEALDVPRKQNARVTGREVDAVSQAVGRARRRLHAIGTGGIVRVAQERPAQPSILRLRVRIRGRIFDRNGKSGSTKR